MILLVGTGDLRAPLMHGTYTRCLIAHHHLRTQGKAAKPEKADPPAPGLPGLPGKWPVNPVASIKERLWLEESVGRKSDS